VKACRFGAVERRIRTAQNRFSAQTGPLGADSGFYADHFLSFLEERALPYIVVAQLTSYLKSRLYQVTEW
jgi:hypothetical protein